jgi:hypothetical protein
VLAGCGNQRSPGKDDAGTGEESDAGVGPIESDAGASPVTPRIPPERAAALADLRSEIERDTPTSRAAFLARWNARHGEGLGYDPVQATHIDLIQASQLKLEPAELALLGQRGFVLSARQAFPTFFYGYKAIYADDLPVFISADSILYAVHRSYGAILKEVEGAHLIAALDALLRGMHESLRTGGGGFAPAVRADVDLYLTVARRLLAGETGAAGQAIVPVAGASAINPAPIAAVTAFGPRSVGASEE